MEAIEEVHKTSRRVVFDVRGRLFASSYESVKPVPCLLSRLADPDSGFKTLDANGAIFIDRNSKHFPTILDIVTNANDCDYWPLPHDIKEFQELLQEVDYYSLPPDLVGVLKEKFAEKEDEVKKQIEHFQQQFNTLTKEKETLTAQLYQETREKADLRGLVMDCQLQTSGCYVSISEVPFALRIMRDKVLWSLSRSMERVQAKSAFFNRDAAHAEMKPTNAQDANIVLWNTAKSYIMCERKGDEQTARIDLCSMGNEELLVIFEVIPNRSAPKSASPEHVERTTYNRIVCRFQSDAR